jgi:hypothetical protein
LANCFTDDKEVEMEVRKWPRQQSKDFYAVGFNVLVKQWNKGIINVSGKYAEKYVFPRFKYHMSYILYPFVTYILTLPCMSRSTLMIPNNYIYRWILDNILYEVGNSLYA